MMNLLHYNFNTRIGNSEPLIPLNLANYICTHTCNQNSTIDLFLAGNDSTLNENNRFLHPGFNNKDKRNQ